MFCNKCGDYKIIDPLLNSKKAQPIQTPKNTKSVWDLCDPLISSSVGAPFKPRFKSSVQVCDFGSATSSITDQKKEFVASVAKGEDKEPFVAIKSSHKVCDNKKTTEESQYDYDGADDLYDDLSK